MVSLLPVSICPLKWHQNANLLFENIFKYPTKIYHHLQDTVQTLPPFSSYPDLLTPQISPVLTWFPAFNSSFSLLLTLLFSLKTAPISSKALFKCHPPLCSQAGNSLSHSFPRVAWHFSNFPRGEYSASDASIIFPPTSLQNGQLLEDRDGSHLFPVPNTAWHRVVTNAICWNDIRINDINLIKYQLNFFFSLHSTGVL